MSLQAVLRLVAETPQAAGIPYMLTGSLAAAYHGAPRATQDIDVVVDAPRRSAGPWASSATLRKWSGTKLGMSLPIRPTKSQDESAQFAKRF